MLNPGRAINDEFEKLEEMQGTLGQVDWCIPHWRDAQK
jgi:hypothetical protein